MIVSRTPLRISLVGGGTDLPSFYQKNGGGAVVSLAIGSYIYVVVNRKFDPSIRVAYSQTENVERLEDLRHELVREALRLHRIEHGIEIHTVADIPGEGTGLGSSSSLTVGLANALYAYQGDTTDNPERLAQEACEIEIKRLHGSMGKQDQYAAAYGGFNFIEFRPDDSVAVQPIAVSRAESRNFESWLSLFYTGIARSSGAILKEQNGRAEDNRSTLTRMRKLSGEMRQVLAHQDWAGVGAMLDEGWHLKKKLANGVTNTQIDALYRRAMAAGALGCKITGAGGGGFLLVVHPPEKTDAIVLALSPLYRLSFRISHEGSRVAVIGW